MIPEPLALLLEKEALKRGKADTAPLIREILSSYFAHRREEVPKEEMCDQQEYLKLRVESLQAALKKKDREISALLELWHIRLGKEGETLTPEEKRMMEKKIGEIQHDWYYDMERRDFSGADDTEGSLSSHHDSGRPADALPDQGA
jgi:hypothetical protein